MISSLTGVVAEREGVRITLDVQGVGYEVYCSTAALLSLGEGQQASRLLVHTEVKEDSIRLFGFGERLEREVFRLLISISGIGARTALEILSATEAKALLRTIASGGAPELQKIKGIGKKTAERIIVELRDKVSSGLQEANLTSAHGAKHASHDGIPYEQSAFDDAHQALCALGFRKEEADRALAAIPDLMIGKSDSATLVKQALQNI